MVPRTARFTTPMVPMDIATATPLSVSYVTYARTYASYTIIIMKPITAHDSDSDLL
ncbi:hypothetical protein DPMN_118723 [Dreissena polymorpha]|uniref:Uncharacterized protein n=1 Tax=Dreissena polymorpha TaxID=45954 RepID=A0A9D4GHW3_DREPO|nr:hypothetical protein DPMN_118723 [Dreissena polymorpha]